MKQVSHYLGCDECMVAVYTGEVEEGRGWTAVSPSDIGRFLLEHEGHLLHSYRAGSKAAWQRVEYAEARYSYEHR